MSVSQLMLIAVTVFSMSAGQVLFKMAASFMPEVTKLEVASVLNLKLLLALAIYGVSTILWFVVLRSVPLRLAYPLSSAAYVLVPVLSHMWTGEPLRVATFVGAFFIFVGVTISVWGGQ